jgi:Cu/Ag efflux protein CusF
MIVTLSPLLLAAGLALTNAAPAAEVRGVVAKVDPDKKELVLDGRGAARGSVLNFRLDASTQVLFGRQAAELADIPTGRRVRIEYEVRDGKAIAKVVHVTGARPPTRPGTKPMPGIDDGSVRGKLWRVGLSDREITVIGLDSKGMETETVFAVPETAKVLRDGKPITLKELKEGEGVRVQAEKDKGKLQAKVIEAGVMAPTTPAPMERGRFLSRLRTTLQMLDEILKNIEER